MKFVADNQSAEPVQPSKQPLHGPAAQVAPQRSAVLHSAPVLTVGRNHLDSVFLAQMPVQRVRVIRLVADRLFAQLVEQAAGQGTADTSPATPATVLRCAESKALRSTPHAYRPAVDPARQSAGETATTAPTPPTLHQTPRPVRAFAVRGFTKATSFVPPSSGKYKRKPPSGIYRTGAKVIGVAFLYGRTRPRTVWIASPSWRGYARQIRVRNT